MIAATVAVSAGDGAGPVVAGGEVVGAAVVGVVAAADVLGASVVGGADVPAPAVGDGAASSPEHAARLTMAITNAPKRAREGL